MGGDRTDDHDGRPAAVDLQLQVTVCAAEVQPAWISFRVVVDGGVYLADPTGGAIRYRALTGGHTEHVPLLEATGQDESCRLTGTILETHWRGAAGSVTLLRDVPDGPGGGDTIGDDAAGELDAIVKVCWRLMREEVVILPGVSPAVPASARRYLLPRIVAEGERIVLVHLHPTPA